MDRVEELLTRGVDQIIPSKEELEKIIMQFKKMRKTVVAISAKKRKGLDLLISQIGKTLAKA